ncbi:ATP-binding protein [Sphingomonas sp.]|uniref:ATP-binding protein n=1 Tax=Sphingomonas sp. TaxID=28214 RepID=UPI002BE1ACAF|nr:ATP-binding protein [Sphingomonas sp.]HTG38982.1 ATP-binding protein [Sphingomonas sp.]
MAEARVPRWLRDDWRGWVVALVLVLGLAVAFGLFRTVIDSNAARDRAIERRSHSFEVLILTESLGGSMARAEASLGRFVISGDKRLGVLYERDWSLARRQIARLERLVRDNPAQARQVEGLARAYADRGTELARVALFSNYARHNQALTAYYEARDSASLRRIQTSMRALAVTERQLLDRRSVALDATVARTNRLAGGLLAIGFMLLALGAFFGWSLIQAIAARKAADAEAADERARAAELEAAVATATASLIAEQGERAAAETRLAQAQKMEAIGQLTGGIAHDFNNMLAVVLGSIELARRHVDGSQTVLRHLDLATEGADRAAALTRQLLAFARVEPLAPEAVDPHALIAGMVPLLDRTLGDGVRIETQSGHRDWMIWADRHRLENALLNLAVNARDAMEGRGQLTITLAAVALNQGQVGNCTAGDHVAIAVTDTGHGMSDDVQARVFEPFFTTKPVGKGTGLGLSQVFGTVQQMGGEIAIDSAPGRGTTVTLYLPRQTGVTSTAPAGDDPHRDTGSRAGLDILVVEDDPRVLRTTMAALGELGHRPVACNDPLAADAALDGMANVDLILSDVVMPGRTGPEVVSALRARRPMVRALFVTGFAGDLDEGTLGGERVLRKPFTLDALEAAVIEAAGG